MSRNYCWAIGLILLFVACDANISYSKVETIPNQLWNYKDSLLFDQKVMHPLVNQDIILTIRNTNNYPYQNLYLKVGMRAPSGKVVIDDTIQLYLSDKYGNWNGSGWGSMHTNEILIRSGYTLQDTGRYVLIVRHLMRDDFLPGINDVAISFHRQGTVQLQGNPQLKSETNNLADTTIREDVAF